MPTTQNKTVRSVPSDTAALTRVNNAWERTTAKLAEARLHLAQAEHTCGQKIADGEDATAATQAVQAAESTVRQFESAVAVLWQRKEDADKALQDTEWAAKLETEAADLAHLRAVAVRGDRILGELESWVHDELSPELAAAYAATATCGRSEGQTAFLHAFRQAFVLCVNRACQPFIPDGRVGLPGFKDRKLSSWLSDDHDPRGTTPREQGG